jgi:hypothetical protein
VIRSLFLCGFCCALVGSARADELNFKLEKDDHICIIGNTLAERMQHDGWLETRLHARHSEHRLVIRNLGFSGDEIDPNKRLRSKDFGSPDEWLAGSSRIPQPKKLPSLENIRQNRFELTETRADVIFAFFGYNESWGGEAGLNDFRVQLDRQLRHMLSKHYNGKTAPRIVLFSPTAFEDLKDPNLPNGEEHNARLAVYTSAMSEVAAANGVFFVNIYEPTRELFSTKQGPFTINGVHLTAVGNQAVAEIIDRILFGASEQSEAEERASRIKAIHAAVRDKNWHWFQRYRATDF